MELALNATVRCVDGEGGRITRIILNPLTKIVTDIAVRGPSRLGAERLVPVEVITTTTPEEVALRISRKELSCMQRFITHEFVPVQDEQPTDGTGGTFYWPYSVPSKSVIDIAHPAIPPDELAVRRGDRVDATDGKIGQVDAFLVSPATEAISHLILREGHLWDRREVTIPVAEIAEIEDGVVHLRLDKQEVEALPAIPAHGLFG